MEFHLKEYDDLTKDDGVDNVLVKISSSTTPVHRTNPTPTQGYGHDQIHTKSMEQSQ